VTDPTGLAGVPTGCAQQGYTNDRVQHARCNVAAGQAQQGEQLGALSDDVLFFGTLPLQAAELYEGVQPTFALRGLSEEAPLAPEGSPRLSDMLSPIENDLRAQANVYRMDTIGYGGPRAQCRGWPHHSAWCDGTRHPGQSTGASVLKIVL